MAIGSVRNQTASSDNRSAVVIAAPEDLGVSWDYLWNEIGHSPKL
jgi:hypothetical protein